MQGSSRYLEKQSDAGFELVGNEEKDEKNYELKHEQRANTSRLKLATPLHVEAYNSLD